MSALWSIARRIWAREWWSLTRGALLAVAVLAAGVGLLGLSGWFITAAGMAGLAGIGIAFDVFRPSAGVRFLALGRTAARYGERILTHDATLRSLAALRVDLLSNALRLPFARTSSFRASHVLNRLTTDVDALDGVALRLVIPLLSAGVTLVGVALMLAWLTDPLFALIAIAGLVPPTLITFLFLLRATRRSSRHAHLAANAFRMRLVDLLRARPELAVTGTLFDRAMAVSYADHVGRSARTETDRAERRAGLVLALAETLTATALLGAGVLLVRHDMLNPALAALAFFAVLALGETVGPLRRGFSELGKMANAARRVDALLTEPAAPAARKDETSFDATAQAAGRPALAFRDVSFGYEGAARPVIEAFSLDIHDGEAVALTGPSGTGKTTLLQLAAGMAQSDSGTVALFGQPVDLWSEANLRAVVGFLPQRSALLSGTIAEALALGRPNLSEAEAWDALETVCLAETIREKGGLQARLGEAGAGLSGGESRRLALGRVLVRKPQVLLLDEPTEGLEPEMAAKVLKNLRQALPDAAIVLASHRQAERDFADRTASVKTMQAISRN